MSRVYGLDISPPLHRFFYIIIIIFLLIYYFDDEKKTRRSSLLPNNSLGAFPAGFFESPVSADGGKALSPTTARR